MAIDSAVPAMAMSVIQPIAPALPPNTLSALSLKRRWPKRISHQL
jgi:hypothetical protein